MGGFRGVDDIAAEETRIVCVLLYANAVEDLSYFVIPMLWATSQALLCAFE